MGFVRHSFLFFVLVAFICSQLCLAESRVSKGTVLVGSEIELEEKYLANLAEFFEYSQVPRVKFVSFAEGFLDSEMDEYLSDWEAFEKLPKSVQESLSKGLNYSKAKLELPQSDISENKSSNLIKPKEPALPSPKGLLGIDGKPLSLGIAESQNKIETQKASEAPIQDVLRMERLSAFAVIKDRWNKLSRRARVDAMTPDGLPRDLKARFLIEVSGDERGYQLPIKSSAPDSIKKLFAGKNWHRDLQSLEIKDDRPTSDLALFEKNLSHLARITKTIDEFNPLNPKATHGASYHLHISVAGKDLTQVAGLYNKVLLLRLLNAGHKNRFGHFGYSNNLTQTGFVRMVDASHFEVRAHTLDPAEELKELTRLVSQDSALSVKELEAEITKRLDDTTLDFLMQKQPSLVAEFVEVSGRQGKLSPRYLEALEAELNHLEKPTPLLNGLKSMLLSHQTLPRLEKELEEILTPERIRELWLQKREAIRDLVRVFKNQKGDRQTEPLNRKLFKEITHAATHGTIPEDQIPLVLELMVHSFSHFPDNETKHSLKLQYEAALEREFAKPLKQMDLKLLRSFIKLYKPHDEWEYFNSEKAAISSETHKTLSMKLSERVNGKAFFPFLKEHPLLACSILRQQFEYGNEEKIKKIASGLSGKLEETLLKKTLPLNESVLALREMDPLQAYVDLSALEEKIQKKIGKQVAKEITAGNYENVPAVENGDSRVLHEFLSSLSELSEIEMKRIEENVPWWLLRHIAKSNQSKVTARLAYQAIEEGEWDTLRRLLVSADLETVASLIGGLSPKGLAGVLRVSPELFALCTARSRSGKGSMDEKFFEDFRSGLNQSDFADLLTGLRQLSAIDPEDGSKTKFFKEVEKKMRQQTAEKLLAAMQQGSYEEIALLSESIEKDPYDKGLSEFLAQVASDRRFDSSRLPVSDPRFKQCNEVIKKLLEG